MQLLGSNITASRLLGVDSGRNQVTQNLSSWIQGTANRLTVTDNGSGGVTLDVSSSLGVAWSALTGKPTTLASMGLSDTAVANWNAAYQRTTPMTYASGTLTIDGWVYFPNGISTVEGINSQGWDQCYYDYYNFYDWVLNVTQGYDQEFAARPLERYVIPTTGTTNIPVNAGKTYLVKFRGHSWDVGGGSDVVFNMPSFSTFRGGNIWIQYADGGLQLIDFTTIASFNCSDGLIFDGHFLFTAGTSGNLAFVIQGQYERLYIIITELVH